MKQLNKQRATLICAEYPNGNCSILVTDILRLFLKDCPSLIERGKCKRKGCSSKKFEIKLAALGINGAEFKCNMANLEKSIMANFSGPNLCCKCHQPYSSVERECGPHLFIEVILNIFKY